jgi:hypothetical protein
MILKSIALIATSFVIGTSSSQALAVSKRTAVTAEKDVRQLMRMMDKDTNGVVSKIHAIHGSDVRSSRRQQEWHA